MKFNMKCPTCDAPVEPENAAHRGLLTNATAMLRSRLISDRERLSALEKKRSSKQFAEAHKRDLVAKEELKARIIDDEALLKQLDAAYEECHGKRNQAG